MLKRVYQVLHVDLAPGVNMYIESKAGWLAPRESTPVYTYQ